jgi:hypothetical protein
MNITHNKHSIVSLSITFFLSAHQLFSFPDQQRSSLFQEMKELIETIETKFPSHIITHDADGIGTISMTVEENDSSIFIHLKNIKLDSIDSLDIKPGPKFDENRHAQYQTLNIPFKDHEATLTIFPYEVIFSAFQKKEYESTNGKSYSYFTNTKAIRKSVPTKIDMNKEFDAEYKDSTLKITVQKCEDAKTRKIFIKK